MRLFELPLDSWIDGFSNWLFHAISGILLSKVLERLPYHMLFRYGKVLSSLVFALWNLDSNPGVLTRLPSGKFTVSTRMILLEGYVHIFSIDPKDGNGNVLVIEEMMESPLPPQAEASVVEL